ncbi:MBL fold metallo-hydrolase [Halorubrum sp. DTA46]|uniref:MBL fold metallo-hydrolase n=1 Tax=Halorubrum sp. DTA46 TaxID=3402162 RepID=UPI003AAA5933
MTGYGDGPGIARIEVPVDTRAPGGTTNAYVVDGLLVDPAARTDALDAAVGVGGAAVGVGDAAVDVTDAAAEVANALEPAAEGVDAIAVTHTHPDHVGAVAEYADLMDATVFAHAAHVDRFVAAAGVEPDGVFDGGERVGDTGVRAVATPGHAADHVAFAVEERGEVRSDDRTGSQALLCGDLAVAEGSVVVGGPDADLRAYLDSLERVRDAGYERLLPGHGPPISDPAETCQRLIGHRLARERTVLAAVEGGASDVDAVVDAAYEKDLTGVEDLARATVVAHLKKLLTEGRIGPVWTERIGSTRTERTDE